MGYWTYYLIWIAAAYLLQHPALLLGVVAVFALRRVLPDPVVWARTASHVRSLRAQIESNPHNATARRDLARIWLERMRPRSALELLDQARERFPNDAELLYLTGIARLRSGDPEGALGPIVQAVEEDPRVGFGDPFRVAGDALAKLRRWEEAEDSYERYTDANHSAVDGWVKLARARRQQDDREGAKEAVGEALRTWPDLPWFHRRKMIRWWLRAQWDRVMG